MIVLAARYYARADTADEVEDLLSRMSRMVAANEPGCHAYQISRSLEDPTSFLIYEQYEDEAALDTHRNTPHFREVIEQRVVPLLERRERELYNLIAG